MRDTANHTPGLIIIRPLFFMLLTTIAFSMSASAPEVERVTGGNISQEYIGKYYKTAIRLQKKHHIPASIILAQALLESGAGQSYLALAGNNHFGIKCTQWRGLGVYKEDDGIRSCFRKYLDVNDSFEDHSRFLASRPHYQSLFRLKITDYKGWAQGLKRYGYASDPDYAVKLIKIIEYYRLHYYDTAKETDPPVITFAAKKGSSKTPQKNLRLVKKNTPAKKPLASSKRK